MDFLLKGLQGLRDSTNDWIIEKAEDYVITPATNHIINTLKWIVRTFADPLIGLLLIGVLVYIVYQCIRMMFFRREEDTQKVLFGYFVFLILRVCGTILGVMMK